VFKLIVHLLTACAVHKRFITELGGERGAFSDGSGSDGWELLAEAGEELGAELGAAEAAGRGLADGVFADEDESEAEDVLGEAVDEATQLISWCMLGGGQWAALIFYLLLLAVFVDQPTIVGERGLVEVPMPAAWERKYVRTGDSTGYEAALLRRSRSGGCWVFVFPDGSMREGRLADRRTIAALPQPGVAYQPLPVFTEDQKAAHLVTAATLVSSQNPILDIASFQRGAGVRAVRGTAGVLMALPAFSARWARWTLRSPFRCAVATLTGFCVYELLDYAKVFTRIGQAATFSYEMYAGVRDGYIEASEWVEWAVMLVDKGMEFIRKFTSPGKFFLLVLMLTALGVSYSWYGDAILSRSSSRAQSTTSSGASSPTHTPNSQAASTGSDLSKVA
jgi:hypothetical protein